MWPSASYALTWIQMRKSKKNGPLEKPNPLDGNLSALWDLVMHVNGRVDKLYALIVGASLSLGLGMVAIFVTVLVK